MCGAVQIETFGERRVQELGVVGEVAEVIHRRHRGVGSEDGPQRVADFLELHPQLGYRLLVVRQERLTGRQCG